MKVKNSTVACALLLASSPVLANTKLGGGQPPQTEDTDSPQTETTKPVRPPINAGKTNQKFNISSISLDDANKRKIKVCDSSMVKQKRPRARNIISLAFSPNKVGTLQFDMEDIPTSKGEQVLLLLYSRCLVKKPKIKTPLSRVKLALDVNDIEILGTYNIPAESTSGKHTQMTIEVDLETNNLAKQAKAGNDTFYFQAALLKKSDFDKKHFGSTKLSPLEAVHVTKTSCPNQSKFSNDVRSVNESCKGLPTKAN